MPSPEHGQAGGNPDHVHLGERYDLVTRFPTEWLARQAYFRSQETVFCAPCDLSVFRFLLNHVSHVAVIGVPPPEELDQQLRRILRAGALSALPGDILLALWERRLQAHREGSWVERHWRPGQPI